MKPTPKADECINLINEISFIADTLRIYFKSKLTDEKVEKYRDKDKLDLLLSVEKDKFENFKKRVNEMAFICYYRLLPSTHFDSNGNSSFRGQSDEVLDDVIQLALNNPTIQPDEIDQLRFVLTRYNEITIDNLKAEFWEISDDIHSFDKSYQIMKYKFKDIYSKIPNPDYYEFSLLMNEPFIKEHIDNLVKHDIATFAEAEKIILRISNVVEELNRKTNQVVELYKSFIENKPQVSEPIPPHKTINYLELKLQDFFRVIANLPKEMTLELTSQDSNEPEILYFPGTAPDIRDELSYIGERTYEQLPDYFKYEIELAELHLNDLEIDNYIDKHTHGFKIEKLKILQRDLEAFTERVYYKELDVRCIRKYKAKGWNIPYIDAPTFKELPNPEVAIPKYEEMREKAFPTHNWDLAKTMNLITKKIKEQQNTDIPNITQENQTKQVPQQTPKPKRAINTTELEQYFTATFKGMGNGNKNRFSTLIEDLQNDRTAKEFAQIALMIHEGGILNDRKPNTFIKWYNIFGAAIGINPHTTYKPAQLRQPSDKLKKIFHYL